jgi:hypothetical protein
MALHVSTRNRERFATVDRPPTRPPITDHLGSRLVLVAASPHQADVSRPVPALDLYAGPAVAAIRDRLGGIPAYRRRVRLLSARHGVVHPDQNLTPYRQPLTPPLALSLRDHLAHDLWRDPTIDPLPGELVVIAGPLWLLALARLLDLPARPTIHWYLETGDDLRCARSTLDRWGWP